MPTDCSPGNVGHLKTATSPWSATAALAVLSTAVLLTLFWPTAVSIVKLWLANVTYSHGVLIIPLFLYLTWTRRERLRSLNPEPTFRTLPLIALLSVTWLLGQLSATDVIQQLSLVALIIVMIWGIVGTSAARALAFPLSFLLFAVPFGAGIIPALQDFSARFAVTLLDLSGIPVYLEGYFITVPYGKWEVAEACSGIQTLVACFVIGFLYGGLVYRTWRRRLTFLAASAIVPILANGVRIYGTVLLGYLSGNAVAIAADHLLYGWVFTSIAMMLLLALGQRWRETPGTRPTAPIEPATAGDPASRDASHTGRLGPAARGATFVVLAAMVVSLAPSYAKLAWGWAADAGTVRLIAPRSSEPWSASNRDAYGWLPGFVAPSGELSRMYVAGDREVKLYVAYFDPGQRDAKVISSTNVLYDRTRWRRVRGVEVVAASGGQSFRVRETAIRSAESSLVLWSWYWVDGMFTGDERLAKFLLAKARLTGSQLGSAAIVLATADRSEQPSASMILRDFLAHMSLQDSLRGDTGAIR